MEFVAQIFSTKTAPVLSTRRALHSKRKQKPPIFSRISPAQIKVNIQGQFFSTHPLHIKAAKLMGAESGERSRDTNTCSHHCSISPCFLLPLLLSLISLVQVRWYFPIQPGSCYRRLKPFWKDIFSSKNPHFLKLINWSVWASSFAFSSARRSSYETMLSFTQPHSLQ